MTNHSLLAVQAGLHVDAVFSNVRIGAFDHLVVDASHAPPGILRNTAGKVDLVAGIMPIAALLERVIGDAFGASNPAAPCQGNLLDQTLAARPRS